MFYNLYLMMLAEITGAALLSPPRVGLSFSLQDWLELHLNIFKAFKYFLSSPLDSSARHRQLSDSLQWACQPISPK